MKSFELLFLFLFWIVSIFSADLQDNISKIKYKCNSFFWFISKFIVCCRHFLKFDFFGKMKCDEESENRHKKFKESKKERDLFGASKPHKSFKVSALNTRLLLVISNLKPVTKLRVRCICDFKPFRCCCGWGWVTIKEISFRGFVCERGFCGKDGKK